MNNNDELYIGWQSRAPNETARLMRKIVAALAIVAVALSIFVSQSQQTIGKALFEWGKTKAFSGVLKLQPYPHLQVPRPGQAAGFSSYYLVAPFKFGLDTEKLTAFADKEVSLMGTLIYRGNQTMIEARPESIQPIRDSTNQSEVAAHSSFPATERQIGEVPTRQTGRQTFQGEIVDSKCFLGVMNPGQLAPHRACAVRCISGGIPPVLLVRRTDAPPLYFLLVSSEGRPVNKEVLDMVAEPVEVMGEVAKEGELLILRADPATFRRLRR